MEWVVGCYVSAGEKLTWATPGEKRVGNGTSATDKRSKTHAWGRKGAAVMSTAMKPTISSLQCKRWRFETDEGVRGACELRELAGAYYLGVGPVERKRLTHRLIEKGALLAWVDRTHRFW